MKPILMSIIGILSMPIINYATVDAIVQNNTNLFLTAKFNYTTCSTIFGFNGIARPHSLNIMPISLFINACMVNPTNCRADIYTTNNCSGPVIGTVFINTNYGIQSALIYNNDFSILIQPTKFILSGGPTVAKF